MRKSFELLDWMKDHFDGSEPSEPGKPGIVYRFTHGLKESGGVVKVDEGNGLSVNEHTGMLEVPIGEHLSYTSQGIDAKEGDTAQKGVVQLTDAIEAHADHTTAATPAAVKEYVDANVVIGGGEGKTYTFQEPLAEHLGAVSVADASKSAKGVVKLASEMTDAANPATAADVKAYVDAKPTGGIDLSENREYSGKGTFRVTTSTDGTRAYSGITVMSADKSKSANCAVGKNSSQLNAHDGATVGVVDVTPNKVEIYAGEPDSPYSLSITPNTATYAGAEIVTKSMISSKTSYGVAKLASTMTDVSNPPTAADVKKYVDANSSGSSYTFDSPLSESQGRVTVAKADEQNLGVVKLTHTVSHGEHPNEAVSPDGVAAYVDAKVAGAGGFSIVKAVGSNPDFALVSGDMIKSGNTLYGVLVFTCVTSPALVTEIASLPATLARSVEVVLTRASNSVLQYAATATGSGTVKFVSEKSVQQGTYVAVIAAQTN